MITGSATQTHGLPIEHGIPRFVRAVYVFAAAMFFTIGLLGIVIPGLPATPFFLLTSFFLARAWPQMQVVFLRCPLVGDIVSDWQRQKGVRLRAKVRAVLCVLAGVTMTCCFSSLTLTIRVIVLLFALAGVITIYRLPLARLEV